MHVSTHAFSNELVNCLLSYTKRCPSHIVAFPVPLIEPETRKKLTFCSSCTDEFCVQMPPVSSTIKPVKPSNDSNRVSNPPNNSSIDMKMTNTCVKRCLMFAPSAAHGDTR